MRTIARLSVVLAAVLAFTAIAPAAFAAGKPETFTEHERDFTDTFTDVFCVGGEDVDTVISVVENGVFHGTFGEDGTMHITGTFVGSFVADPIPAGLPTYTGRYTVWFGENQNPNVDNTTFTFSATGRGSDGSTTSFGSVGHITAGSITWDADDEPITDGLRSQFFRTRCN